MPNTYKNKVVLRDGTTIMDITDTTATASDVAQGKYFYAATGEKTLGTASGGGGGAVVVTEEQLSGGGIAKHITAVDISDTTAVASDVAQGKYFYTASGVKTAGTASGGSSWTKVAETSYQVSTTNTSPSDVGTFTTGHSEIWTSNKVLYIRIRDTVGKRAGYYYGTDAWFINMYPKNSSSTTETNTGLVMQVWSVNSNGDYTYRNGYGSTGYGVYPLYIYSDGQIRLRTRYHDTYTRTVNSTYSVEVYLLDPPTGAPIFT